MTAPGMVRVGQRWEFVHKDGEVREYVVAHAENEEWKGAQGYASWVRLLNEASGRYAHVSVGWLRRQPGPTGSHWRFVAEPQMAAAA